MKRGTPQHPKTYALARALGCRRAEAVGYLELLWHFTAQYAPCGDIGRHSDDAIESGCDWGGASGALVVALSETRWLDVSTTNRLVVHDWHEHADQGVRNHLQAQRKSFVTTKGRTRVGPTLNPSRTLVQPGSDQGSQGKGNGIGNGQVLVSSSGDKRESEREKGERTQRLLQSQSAVRFASFWSGYPKKVKKAEAEKAWSKIRDSDELLKEMHAALRWQKRSPDWTRDAGQYIPHPATWLNARQWEDEPPPGMHPAMRSVVARAAPPPPAAPGSEPGMEPGNASKMLGTLITELAQRKEMPS